MKNIGEMFQQHAHLAKSTIEDLLRLGDKMLDNLDDDHIDKFFLDLDF